MNETVKAALLAQRESQKESLGWAEANLRNVEKRISGAQADVAKHRQCLADVEAFLRDNGVDLAAVDAEAEKARMALPSAMQIYANSQGMNNQANAIHQNALGSVNTGLGRALSSFGSDPTAGLAKALDEA